MEENSFSSLDEIDLKKLFKDIWKKKILIIIFSCFITSLAVLYTLSLPNKYSSTVIFEQQGQTNQKQGSKRLSSLAGLAGLSLNDSSNANIFDKMKLILSDYDFNKKIVEKYKIYDILNKENFDKEYIFPKNKRFMYEFLNDKKVYSLASSISLVRSMITLTKNKKTGFLFLTATHANRKFAKYTVDIFLKELASEIKNRDLNTVERKIEFYSNELKRTTSIELKNQLSNNISELLKKKILANINELYLFEVIVSSKEPFIGEKTTPKRSKTIFAVFVFSFILSVAFVLGRSFFKYKNY